jgi:hypothetical protein
LVARSQCTNCSYLLETFMIGLDLSTYEPVLQMKPTSWEKAFEHGLYFERALRSHRRPEPSRSPLELRHWSPATAEPDSPASVPAAARPSRTPKTPPGYTHAPFASRRHVESRSQLQYDKSPDIPPHAYGQWSTPDCSGQAVHRTSDTSNTATQSTCKRHTHHASAYPPCDVSTHYRGAHDHMRSARHSQVAHETSHHAKRHTTVLQQSSSPCQLPDDYTRRRTVPHAVHQGEPGLEQARSETGWASETSDAANTNDLGFWQHSTEPGPYDDDNDSGSEDVVFPLFAPLQATHMEPWSCNQGASRKTSTIPPTPVVSACQPFVRTSATTACALQPAFSNTTHHHRHQLELKTMAPYTTSKTASQQQIINVSIPSSPPSRPVMTPAAAAHTPPRRSPSPSPTQHLTTQPRTSRADFCCSSLEPTVEEELTAEERRLVETLWDCVHAVSTQELDGMEPMDVLVVLHKALTGSESDAPGSLPACTNHTRTPRPSCHKQVQPGLAPMTNTHLDTAPAVNCMETRTNDTCRNMPCAADVETPCVGHSPQPHAQPPTAKHCVADVETPCVGHSPQPHAQPPTAKHCVADVETPCVSHSPQPHTQPPTALHCVADVETPCVGHSPQPCQQSVGYSGVAVLYAQLCCCTSKTLQGLHGADPSFSGAWSPNRWSSYKPTDVHHVPHLVTCSQKLGCCLDLTVTCPDTVSADANSGPCDLAPDKRSTAQLVVGPDKVRLVTLAFTPKQHNTSWSLHTPQHFDDLLVMLTLASFSLAYLHATTNYVAMMHTAPVYVSKIPLCGIG